MIDPTLVRYYSGFNAYKNDSVKLASVTVSGTLGAGAVGDYETTITLDELPLYFTAQVKTTNLVGGVVRWQSMPSSLYYDVPCSGPLSSLAVMLTIIVNGNNVTFRAWTMNPAGSTITWSTTNIDFRYVPKTLAN